MKQKLVHLARLAIMYCLLICTVGGNAFAQEGITINGKVYELYLQLETATGDLTTSQICLKLSAQDEKTDRDHLRATRDHLVYTHDWTYKLNEFHFHKPKRLAMGRHMTIGVYDASLTDFNDFMKALQLAVQDYNKILLTLHGTISK